MITGSYAEALSSLRPQLTGEAAQSLVDRAAGLLAGRAHCRVADAHRYLLRAASDRRQDVAEVAAGVLRLLDTVDPDPLHAAGPSRLLAAAGTLTPTGEGAVVRRFEPWLAMVQHVLDVLPGMSAYLTAERDAAGRLTDLIWAAASPDAVAPDGGRGSRLIGARTTERFPGIILGGRWAVYQSVLDTGCPAQVGPVRWSGTAWVIRVHRLGQGLLASWTRVDDKSADTDRTAATERLAGLGWAEWDLVSGEIYWSDQLFRIYERDPALGPLSLAECRRLAVADDEPLRLAALQALDRSETVDVTTRVLVGGRIKHLRTVADAVRDTGGNPLRIFGIVQDVTEREDGARRLAEVERRLAEQRRSLAAEHALAARLQQIILPLPDGPVDLPGLRIALRYLPAAREDLVGGDWYHAAELRDGTVLLAVGDVAGHGTQAATTMAQLRHAVRALSVTSGDPGALLGHLNRLTCDLERESPELSATAVIARFDPATREIVWAQAGHPPPLLCRDGHSRLLDRPAGTVLGVVEDAVYPTARLAFHPGDLLMLYTDGLVEHRRRGLDEGVARVLATIDAAVHASPRRPLAQVLARLRRANPQDDTCILACRPLLSS